jgi:hypothetical protein
MKKPGGVPLRAGEFMMLEIPRATEAPSLERARFASCYF